VAGAYEIQSGWLAGYEIKARAAPTLSDFQAQLVNVRTT